MSPETGNDRAGRRQRPLFVVLLWCVVAVVVTLWIWSGRRPVDPAPGAASSRDATAGPQEHSAAPPISLSGDDGAAATATTRVAVAGAADTGLATVAIVVWDADGARAAGAMVALTGWDGPVGSEVRCDDLGTVRLALPFGAYRVSARRGDQTGACDHVVARDPASHRILVGLRGLDGSPPCSTRVELRDAAGLPQPGVRIDLTGAADTSFGYRTQLHRTAITDAAGVARWTDLAARGVLLTVAWPDGSAVHPWFDPDAGNAVVIRLQPPATGELSGSVRDQAGRPMPAQPLLLLAVAPPGGGWAWCEVGRCTTDAHGRYAVRLAVGHYLVTVPPESSHHVRRAEVRIGSELRSDLVDLRGVAVAAGQSCQQDVVLEFGATIEGRLVWRGGAVHGGSVRLVHLQGSAPPATESGAPVLPTGNELDAGPVIPDLVRIAAVRAGSFQVNGLRPGYWLCRLEHPTLCSTTTLVRVDAGARVECRVSAAEPAAVHGISWPGLRVILRSQHAGNGAAVAAVDPADTGAFALAPIPAGEYQVCLQDGGPPLALQLQPGERRYLDLRDLPGPRYLLAGIVHGLQPADEALLTLDTQVVGLESGHFQLRSRVPLSGRLLFRLRIRDGASDQQWELEAIHQERPGRQDLHLGPHRLSVQLADATAGAVHVELTAVAVATDLHRCFHLSRGRVDHGQPLQFARLLAGRYRLQASFADGATVVRSVVIPTDAPVLLARPEHGRVVVDVRRSAGRTGVLRVRLAEVPTADGDRAQALAASDAEAIVDADGHAEFAAVPIGPRLVGLCDDDRIGAVRLIQVGRQATHVVLEEPW